METNKTEFIPFGREWEAEMNKWDKPLLITKIRDLLEKNKELKERYDDLAERYNDLLSSNGY